MKRYTSTELHKRFCESLLSATWRMENPNFTEACEWPQALHCPYYVPLEGRLGADWGVIVNPDSERFMLLTFEHDWCGCPCPEGVDDPELTHWGEPQQQGDTWHVDWKHECDEMCEDPCEEKE